MGGLFFSCCVEEGGCGGHKAQGCCSGCSRDKGEGALCEHPVVSDRVVGVDEMEWRSVMVIRGLMCTVLMLERARRQA
jgi:hypothetical protein